ncbi:YwiC-like family protein [Cytobacillus sp. FJAT-54145]|uniref:YwiC-like family protein n=1 Tax=Cytobacillus spartinae TaxID=3299023 RepID=A0ABW6K815_9BACI
MKLFLPKQHGAWAMLIIPFWLGVISTSFIWEHIPFFIGWLFLYLATYPMLLLFKKKKIPFYMRWTLIYLIPALILLIIPLVHRPSIIYFGIAMFPFFIINAYFSSKNKERAFLNDLSAITVFGIAGLASSYLVTADIHSLALLAFVTTFLFFVGSTFYVKTMIREKKNQLFKYLSWGYHVLVSIVWLFSGQWLITLAFLPSLYRAIFFYGKPLSAKEVGILEIVNASFFFIVISVVLIFA